ncbi:MULTISPECIES: STAS domain-containing protein [Streptomyces]|uniref:STAS domain-containing protein n=1 Tax=Streptomyces TaxID=1883 RepID=UPI00163D153A|nr:STAS domain-containing protein [Streptomyces sp. WAC05292]
MAADEERTPVPAATPPAGGRCVVRVSGEMDIDHAAALRTALDAAISRAPDRVDVVVDLRNSSFCDSSGLTVLLAAREKARADGHALRLAAPSHQLLRLLELTGSVELFSLGSTAED